MGYVKTPEEIEDIQSLMQNISYEAEGLEVWFQTSPEFIASVLPPCFSPAAQARGFVQFGVSRSARTAFRSAAIYVLARFGDAEGWYHLTMVMTGDMPVTLGRELWGEAKKRGELTFDPQPPRITGYADRNGTRLIEVAAELGDDLGERDEVHTVLDLKAFPNGRVTDLDYDPIVFVAKASTHFYTYREGTATMKFQSSSEDPCGDIPILSVDKATYGRRTMRPTIDTEHRLVGREGYLPYLLGRSYDVVRHPELAESTS
jgi:hypothetical protein